MPVPAMGIPPRLSRTILAGPGRSGIRCRWQGCCARRGMTIKTGAQHLASLQDGDQTLLVDTLFDLKLTQAMLDAMRQAVPAAKRIPTVVNTHNNGDHVFGNQLVAEAEIIASKACAEDMELRRPEGLAQMMANWQALGPGAQFFYETMGSKFAFEGIRHTPPTRTFEKALTIPVGGKTVQLLEVGPA